MACGVFSTQEKAPEAEENFRDGLLYAEDPEEDHTGKFQAEQKGGTMIRVTVWNEYKHERELKEVKAVYPHGIHECIREFLEKEEEFQVRTAVFSMEEHGLTEEVLENTDVLIFWSHALQEEFSQETARRIQRHVLGWMGLIALHSAHFSKVMKGLLGTSMTLKWRHGDRERLWCTAPAHPIAQGVEESIEIPREEMYGEYFDIPKPDDVVFTGWFSGGEVFRSGCTFTRGKGKIFYFQPGHEEYPVHYIPGIQKIIKNAVRWCAPSACERNVPECQEFRLSPEEELQKKGGVRK